MKFIHAFAAASALFTLTSAAIAQNPIKQISGKPIPSEFDTGIGVYGGELLEQWKDLQGGVNAPQLRTRAFPGQRMIIAVAAKGDEREKLIQGATFSFTLDFGGITKSFSDLRPTMIRSVKAHGADFVKYALTHAKVTNAQELDSKLSMVSLALFDVGWTIPMDAKDGVARIRGTIQGAGKQQLLKESTLEIQCFDTAIKEGPFKSQEDLSNWTVTYYQHPEPIRLLHAMRVMGSDEKAFVPNVRTFYVQALRSSPAAAQFILGRLKGEERPARLYGFQLLREAGIDITQAVAALPPDDQNLLTRVASQIPALPDPYDLSVREEDPMSVTTRMDMLWSIFVVHGDSKPVRAVANVLAWRDDWKVYQKVKEEYQKTGKGPSRWSSELIRASAYGAAGWSLGSFYRSHGLATDYIEALKGDSAMSEVVREELRNLIGNPAFKMEK